MAWLSQTDPRWGNNLLGNGPGLISQYGCYLTTFTNIDNISNDHRSAGEVTVEDTNAWFINNGRFVGGDELTDQSLNDKDGCSYVGTQNFPAAADLNWFSDDVNTQDAIEIWINGNSARTHFVLYYSGHSAGDFRIVDSWDGQVKLLGSAYGDPATIIQKGVRYTIPGVPAPTAPPVDTTVPVPTPEPLPIPVPVVLVPPTPQTPSPVVVADPTPVSIPTSEPPVAPQPTTVKSFWRTIIDFLLALIGITKRR